MTKGMKSSEFWLTVIGMAIALLAHSWGVPLTTETLATGAGLTGAYAISRGLAKRGPS